MQNLKEAVGAQKSQDGWQEEQGMGKCGHSARAHAHAHVHTHTLYPVDAPQPAEVNPGHTAQKGRSQAQQLNYVIQEKGLLPLSQQVLGNIGTTAQRHWHSQKGTWKRDHPTQERTVQSSFPEGSRVCVLEGLGA